jgi:26S proteasome regulatory subunit N6
MEDDREGEVHSSGGGDPSSSAVAASRGAAPRSALHEALEQATTPASLQALILDSAHSGEDDLRAKELAISKLSALYVSSGDMASLRGLLGLLRPYFALVPKARTAKVVRAVIEALSRIPGSTEVQVAVCLETVEWCKAEKRSFLRLRVQLKLSQLCVKRPSNGENCTLACPCSPPWPPPSLPPPHTSAPPNSLLEQGKLPQALATITGLLREVKRLDDKALLVELHLIESKVLFELKNLPKSRASLTAGRTAAGSIYVGPEVQAEIDMQAGVLCAEERDYRTAFSYFYEAFEGRNSLGEASAVAPLRYMLLCKVMMEQPEDVPALIAGKAGLRHAGRGLEAMRAMAQAYRDRSLGALERALTEFADLVQGDAFLCRHVALLADRLLEQNLLRLIEPFSCVELAHLAALIGLPLPRVQAKLGQLILDKRLHATLDQGRGQLVVYDGEGEDEVYASAIKAVKNLGAVVEVLQKRADSDKL